MGLLPLLLTSVCKLAVRIHFNKVILVLHQCQQEETTCTVLHYIVEKIYLSYHTCRLIYNQTKPNKLADNLFLKYYLI